MGLSVLGWIVLGLVAGFIGGKIVNRQGEGFVVAIILGVVGAIVGAIVGGDLFNAFGAPGVSGLNIYSMFVAVVGAIVVLMIYHALFGRRTV